MNENSVVNGAEPKNSPPEALIPPVPDDFDPSIFPRELKEHNGVIFIMLRNIVPKTTGLEMSAFRRAKLFREKFGIDVYLKTDQWRDIFSARIADARRHTDLVFVAPHWGNNDATEPLEYQKTLDRLLIDLGADAVLGCHAHVLQGVENYKGRPIVYDAGNFLFDTRYFPRGADGVDTGGFLLTVDRNGVRSINFTPLRNGFGFVKIDARHRDRINKNFVEMCRALDTAAAINDDGTVDIAFDPAPRGVVHKEEPSTLIDPLTIERRLIEPLSEPRPEWTVERVPDEAIIRPIHFGPIKMVGYRIPPEYRTLKKRGIIYVETYWTIDQPVPSDCRLQISIKPTRECIMYGYDTNMDHDFCDWM